MLYFAHLQILLLSLNSINHLEDRSLFKEWLKMTMILESSRLVKGHILLFVVNLWVLSTKSIEI